MDMIILQENQIHFVEEKKKNFLPTQITQIYFKNEKIIYFAILLKLYETKLEMNNMMIKSYLKNVLVFNKYMKNVKS